MPSTKSTAEMQSQPPPEAQQHPCTQPRNPSCSHSALVSHLACSHARSLICAGIRAETFLPPTCQLTRFTSPTCLSPPSLTKAGASPQASGHFFPPQSGLLLVSSPRHQPGAWFTVQIPHCHEEPISIHTHPGTHCLSPTRASSSSVQTTGRTKPA